MIRVLIADDHLLVRQGLRLLLEKAPDIEVVGEARDGREAVEQTRQLTPDIVLMDVDMPRMDGIQATRIIHSSRLPTQVLMLTMIADQNMQQVAEANGAQGYLLKSADREELTQAIRAAIQGRRPARDKGARERGATAS